MSKGSQESKLCKDFVLNGDWDRAVAVLSTKDKGGKCTAEYYANRAYARCFQLTKNHRDGNYDDAVEDASNALVNDCQNNHQNNRHLCIRAYSYYLNNNYDDAIADCEEIIKTAAAAEAAFTHELMGIMYENKGYHYEASKYYKKAMLARQTDTELASPLLMDAYRNTHAE
jgi:tetratricopeptide (TPR) repeat protein